MKTQLLFLTALALTLPLAGANAQSGSLDTTFMPRVGPNSIVNAIVVQPDGKTVFGGAFTQVNLVQRNRLARADADGNLDAGFDPGTGPDGVVHALALQGDGKVLIGGAFTNYNGTPHSGLARLNTDGTLDTTFDPGAGANGAVTFVAARTNGSVLIQGSFTSYNGTTRLGLARLSADGSLDTSFDPGSRAANLSALAWQPDGKVVFSGTFSSLDGLSATNLARLNADGSLDTNFTALASLDTYADSVVVQRNGRILLSGGFTNANGVPLNRIARLNPDGSLDAGFNPGTGINYSWAWFLYPLRSVEQSDGRLLVYGIFTTFNGTDCNGAVRLSPDGSLDSLCNPADARFPDGQERIIPQADGRMLVTYDSVPFLCRYLADGPVDATWMNENGANGNVQTIVLQPDGKSLLGGEFTQVNGAPRTGLARLNPDGSLDASFNPILGNDADGNAGLVYAIALQPDGKLVVGGWFPNINGVARNSLARLNGDGSLDASFNPTFGTNDWVQTVVVQPDGQLLVSGVFATGTGAEDWTSVVRLNPDGSMDPAFVVHLHANGAGITLQPDGKLVVVGSFTNINSVARTNLARLNPNGSLDVSFVIGSGPEPWWHEYLQVSAVALQSDGRLLVGGNFVKWNGTNRSALVRLLPDGRLDETFPLFVRSMSPVSTVYALLAQPDGRILVGGRIRGTNGQWQSVVRLNPDGNWDTTFNPESGPNSYVLCLALQTDGNLLIGGSFSSVSEIPRGGVARLINEVITQPVMTVTSAYVTSWAGSNAILGVSLLGPPPFFFQWQFNGTNLPGQNDRELQFTNLLATDAGCYTLIVSNASGLATSAPVQLTVLPASARPGTLDTAFTPGAGADNFILSVGELAEGKLLVGGGFGTFNGEPHGGLVRLNPDGRVDPNFTASGVGSGQLIAGIVPQPDGRLIIGGRFTSFNGALRTNLVRLHPDGRLDESFTANVDVMNPIGRVGPIAWQSDGKILVGGNFSEVNGATFSNLARLYPDGAIDASFDPGLGADKPTTAIVLQPDGQILVSGGFNYFNGVARGGLTRLNANGSTDINFNPGPAANGAVHALARQPDGMIIIGGEFSAFNGVPRSKLARLNPDGSLDATFVPAAPAWLANSYIDGIVVQTDGKILAATFSPYSTYAGYVARFNPDGSLDSSFALGTGAANGIWCLAGRANGQLFAGGFFTAFNGVPKGRLVRLHGDEALPTAAFSLTARMNGGLQLEWPSATGSRYQLQSATSLPATTWTDEGVPFDGTGGVLATNLPIGNQPKEIFRLQLLNN